MSHPQEFTAHAGAAQLTRQRCLFGVNLLLVDDSRAVSEAIRLMAVKSGARLRRADCVTSAKKHLNVFQPDLMIVDLSLPDGTGTDLIKDLGTLTDLPPAVLIASGAQEDEVAAAAEACGADGYLVKPIPNLRVFQEAVLNALHISGKIRPDAAGGYVPDVMNTEALRFDLENMLDLLGEAVNQDNRAKVAFCARFLFGVASTTNDENMRGAAQSLDQAVRNGGDYGAPAEAVLNQLARRIDRSWKAAS